MIVEVLVLVAGVNPIVSKKIPSYLLGIKRGLIQS